MSHYTVLVVGPEPEEQLQPFHEFECTGEDDQYVQDIDQTAEARAQYKKDKKRMYKTPTGRLVDPYLHEFYRDPTPEELKEIGSIAGSGSSGKLKISWHSEDWNDGRGYRARIHFLPKGYKEVEVPRSKVESFRNFIENYHGKKLVLFGQKPDLKEAHKYGYALLNKLGLVTKVINRTNPNAKWDWYQIGGRWNGFFKLKSGGDLPVWAKGTVGKPGLNKMDEGYRPPAIDRADQTLKVHIDIEGMRQEAADKALAKHRRFNELTAGLPLHKSWKEVMGKAKFATDKMRDEYHNQPAVKALHDAKGDELWWNADDFLCTEAEYVQQARDNAIATFAVLMDGQWYSRGEMGWWGCVHDEMEEGRWPKEFAKLFDQLPENVLLTIVDCHI